MQSSLTPLQTLWQANCTLKMSALGKVLKEKSWNFLCLSIMSFSFGLVTFKWEISDNLREIIKHPRLNFDQNYLFHKKKRSKFNKTFRNWFLGNKTIKWHVYIKKKNSKSAKQVKNVKFNTLERPSWIVPANSPAATNSPKSASKMEHVKPPSSMPTIKSPPHQPKPEIRAPPAEPKPSQILIFSNSICKRINASRFYRGRTTRLYAKSGATIAQIQRQVENCEDEDPKHVILQAWTNNVMRESVESVKTKARNLVNATLKKFPTARIIVSGILPRLITTDMSNAANDIIAHLNGTFAQNYVNSTIKGFPSLSIYSIKFA